MNEKGYTLILESEREKSGKRSEERAKKEEEIIKRRI